MSRVASYLLARYVADPIRNEPRNVGVFVRLDGQVQARFRGESADGGKLDRRHLQSLRHPDVYEQWVEYWRGVLSNEPDPFPVLLSTGAAHYHVIPGGEVTDIGDDSPAEVPHCLYGRLVAHDRDQPVGERGPPRGTGV